MKQRLAGWHGEQFNLQNNEKTMEVPITESGVNGIVLLYKLRPCVGKISCLNLMAIHIPCPPEEIESLHRHSHEHHELVKQILEKKTTIEIWPWISKLQQIIMIIIRGELHKLGGGEGQGRGPTAQPNNF